MIKIMDYEKLYKEALERAKIAYKDEDRHLKATLERIFPVLKESEDEMIRKGLIEHLKELKEQSVEGSHLKRPEHYDAWIAWLEKHKKVDQKFNIGDTVCRKFYEDHTIKRIYYDCNDPVYVCKNEEGLESHIPFSEQDEWELKETTNVKATKDTPNKVQPQPKQDWSEEDEKMWLQIINEIEAIKSNSSTIFEKNIAQDKIDWLKSLKDRVQPQPNQEWSEEDEKNWRHCLHYIDAYVTPVKEHVDWFKNIRNRIHSQTQQKQEWSEENEERLNQIADYLKYKGYEDDSIWLKSLKDRFQL